MLEVVGQETTPAPSSREKPERRLGQVVRAEREEIGVLGELARRAAQRAAARSWCRTRYSIPPSSATASAPLPRRSRTSSSSKATSGCMISSEGAHRFAARRRERRGRSRESASRRSPATRARAGNRAFRASGSPRAERSTAGSRRLVDHAPRSAAGTRAAVGRAAGSSPAVRHRLEDSLEVALLHRQQLRERPPRARSRRSEDHLAHDRQPVLGHDMCRARQSPIPSAPLPPGPTCIRRCVGVCVDSEPTELVRPLARWIEILARARAGSARQLPMDHLPGARRRW